MTKTAAKALAAAVLLSAGTALVQETPIVEMGDAPMVVETPPNVLGVINDHWFCSVIDFGHLGPDDAKELNRSYCALRRTTRRR